MELTDEELRLSQQFKPAKGTDRARRNAEKHFKHFLEENQLSANDLLKDKAALETVLLRYFKEYRVHNDTVPSSNTICTTKSHLKSTIMLWSDNQVDIMNPHHFPRFKAFIKRYVEEVRRMGQGEAKNVESIDKDPQILSTIYDFLLVLYDMMSKSVEVDSDFKDYLAKIPSAFLLDYHYLCQYGAIFLIIRHFNLKNHHIIDSFEKAHFRIETNPRTGERSFIKVQGPKDEYHTEGRIPFEDYPNGFNPGKYFQRFMTKLNPNSVYLLTRPMRKSSTWNMHSNPQVWYETSKLGVNQVGKAVPVLSEAIGLEKISNRQCKPLGLKKNSVEMSDSMMLHNFGSDSYYEESQGYDEMDEYNDEEDFSQDSAENLIKLENDVIETFSNADFEDENMKALLRICVDHPEATLAQFLEGLQKAQYEAEESRRTDRNRSNAKVQKEPIVINTSSKSLGRSDDFEDDDDVIVINSRSWKNKVKPKPRIEETLRNLQNESLTVSKQNQTKNGPKEKTWSVSLIKRTENPNIQIALNLTPRVSHNTFDESDDIIEEPEPKKKSPEIAAKQRVIQREPSLDANVCFPNIPNRNAKRIRRNARTPENGTIRRNLTYSIQRRDDIAQVLSVEDTPRNVTTNENSFKTDETGRERVVFRVTDQTLECDPLDLGNVKEESA